MVSVRVSVRGQMTMRKFATAHKDKGALHVKNVCVCVCVCLYYPPVVLCLKKLELLLDAVQ